MPGVSSEMWPGPGDIVAYDDLLTTTKKNKIYAEVDSDSTCIMHLQRVIIGLVNFIACYNVLSTYHISMNIWSVIEYGAKVSQ